MKRLTRLGVSWFRWLAVMSFSCSVAVAQTIYLKERPDTCRFHVTVTGKFNSRAAWDVNLVNAPAKDFSLPPVHIDIADSLLDLMNERVEPIFLDLLDSMGVRYSREEKDYELWRGIAARTPNDSDIFFSLGLSIDGENPLGGHYGGLDLRLKFASFHRNPKLVYGFGLKKVPVPRSSREAVDNLSVALGHVLNEAINDWLSVIREERMRPRRTFTLMVSPRQLNSAQITYIKDVVLPCLQAQVAGFDYMKELKEEGAYRIYCRTEQRESESDFLARSAETISMSIGTHGKYPCSLWRTPLDGLKPEVVVDTTTQTVTLQWKRSP